MEERGELRTVSRVEISRTHIWHMGKKKYCAFKNKIKITEGKMKSSALTLLIEFELPGGYEEELVKDSHV